MGAITDDTQMALFTAEGLLQADDRLNTGVGYPPARLLDAYHRWLSTQGIDPAFNENASWHGELHRFPAMRHRRAPGTTCLGALQGPARDWDINHGAVDNDSKGCGGVMRAAPCGLVRWYGVEAFEIGSMAASLTHGHPSSTGAAGALAQIIAELTELETTGDLLAVTTRARRPSPAPAEVRGPHGARLRLMRGELRRTADPGVG